MLPEVCTQAQNVVKETATIVALEALRVDESLHLMEAATERRYTNGSESTPLEFFSPGSSSLSRAGVAPGADIQSSTAPLATESEHFDSANTNT